MKIWIVTSINDEGEFMGASAHATPAGAVAELNEAIDEENEDLEPGDAKRNHILYPVTTRTLKLKINTCWWEIEPDTLKP